MQFQPTTLETLVAAWIIGRGGEWMQAIQQGIDPESLRDEILDSLSHTDAFVMRGWEDLIRSVLDQADWSVVIGLVKNRT